MQKVLPANVRYDRYNNPIIKEPPGTKKSHSSGETKQSKKEKDKNKHKITFVDKIDKDADLARVYYVLSYKKYNAMNTFDPFEVEEGESASHCCTIF